MNCIAIEISIMGNGPNPCEPMNGPLLTPLNPIYLSFVPIAVDLPWGSHP